MKWAKVCHEYVKSNPGKVVTRFVFSKLLHQAWTAMSASNIISGFRITGIYPLDRSATAVITRKPESPMHTGLKFLLLCSPAPHNQALQVAKEVSVLLNRSWKILKRGIYTEESAETNV